MEFAAQYTFFVQTSAFRSLGFFVNFVQIKMFFRMFSCRSFFS